MSFVIRLAMPQALRRGRYSVGLGEGAFEQIRHTLLAGEKRQSWKYA